MKLAGWGNYPMITANVSRPSSESELMQQLYRADKSNSPFIARGLGRSYGDSALAGDVLSLTSLDHFINFDESNGQLTCQAGVSLATILNVFVPKGWFLTVTPGTKFVTVGGAIASDVHGKNHHVEGCFSEHVKSLKIATLTQGCIECSRTVNSDLFFATCGGMGLTGIIVEATFVLKRIESAYIDQVTYKTKNLEEALVLFETHQSAHYSVAWIDCLASGDSLGRSLVMLGEHSQQGGLCLPKKRHLTVPAMMPSFLLNQYSIQAFNHLYYQSVREMVSKKNIGL